ncbi:MAG: S9 family peptidase [Candidatus Eremiobacteraeota bacterium]|nr:S9 family peptidase [Candidatus Eremiobacteraeota bacterium]
MITSFIRRAVVAAMAVSFFGVLGLPAAAGPRAVLPEDIYKIALVSNPQISPNGKLVAFEVRRPDGPNDSYDTSIWLVHAAGGAPSNLTRGTHDGNPVWSPNGRELLFVRAAKKSPPQIYAYDLTRHSIRQLTKGKAGATGPVYSNSGSRIAYSVVTKDSVPNAQINFAAAGFKPKKSQLKSDIHVINEMHFEANGAGYVYQLHPHIWVMNADGSHSRPLTSGTTWSENGYSWSPDDRYIAFNSLRYHTPSLGPNDIYTIPSAGGAMRKLASDQPANNGPTYAHHGNRIWYFASGYLDPSAGNFPALVSSNSAGSDRTVLVPAKKVEWGDVVLADMGEPGGVCGLLFTPDDHRLVINVNGPGYSHLVKMDTHSGAMTDLTAPRGEVSNCSMSADGKSVAYTYADFLHPNEIFMTSIAGGTPRKLTDLNRAYLQSVRLSTPQPFTVKDSAGTAIQAWFMPAIDAKPGIKYPTILDIHGGPQTQFGETFFHELQYLAGRGYNVVFSDPRGSVGFGYDFEEALNNNWGDVMFDDVQAVMNAAIKRPDVDASRLAVSGGSYGGYATLWVISHTNRYKAAIAERVVSNLATEQLAADLASDNALGGRYDWGLPWEAGNKYLAQSPVSYVGNVKTPLLILHSEDDTRTPIDQTLQEFNALKILGRTVRFVAVPGENHDLSRTGSPLHRVERLHVLYDWMAGYLR